MMVVIIVYPAVFEVKAHRNAEMDGWGKWLLEE